MNKTLVKFLCYWRGYRGGVVAGFDPKTAKHLITAGLAEPYTAPTTEPEDAVKGGTLGTTTTLEATPSTNPEEVESPWVDLVKRATSIARDQGKTLDEAAGGRKREQLETYLAEHEDNEDVD